MGDTELQAKAKPEVWSTVLTGEGGVAGPGAEDVLSESYKLEGKAGKQGRGRLPTTGCPHSYLRPSLLSCEMGTLINEHDGILQPPRQQTQVIPDGGKPEPRFIYNHNSSNCSQRNP